MLIPSPLIEIDVEFDMPLGVIITGFLDALEGNALVTYGKCERWIAGREWASTACADVGLPS
jgi:hypothetical protein